MTVIITSVIWKGKKEEEENLLKATWPEFNNASSARKKKSVLCLSFLKYKQQKKVGKFVFG